MDSSDLFSHRETTQTGSPGDTSHEAVEMPVFSDQPKKWHPTDSPSE
ncbi:hypothetical protein [Mycolicibacterium gilvum]|uniref:Uncharacterized protein n=1 Tax=Mycolicibacterium gilvum TaxID=1804 RepID=A0A378SGK5_9MYCO|nr:hypothetical protein [Mycolicibacterium gilvum]MCV7057114.1 hypothetical protein [Mycolicibacterium gilvum]STZ41741.1 Uncharacterised protein [Mycolicibacterium gilvum]